MPDGPPRAGVGRPVVRGPAARDVVARLEPAVDPLHPLEEGELGRRVLGVAGAWGITQALADEGVSTFVLPSGQMLAIVVLAALAGVVAALGPARRAGRLNVLEAIATQ